MASSVGSVSKSSGKGKVSKQSDGVYTQVDLSSGRCKESRPDARETSIVEQ